MAGVLKYGFEFRRAEVQERVLHDSIENVSERGCAGVGASQDHEPVSAVIRGVDDAWEVCLLKFAVDLVRGSAGGNVGDLRRRGLL